jgi:Rne/Rng family ribonuclease
MKRMIVNYENLQTRIALTNNDRIEEYYIEAQGSKRIVGSIYKGRIRNLEPSLQAAFVDIGLEKNAFLHYWDMIPASDDDFEDEEDEDINTEGAYLDVSDDDDNDDSGSSKQGGGNRGNQQKDNRKGGRGNNRNNDNRNGDDRQDRNNDNRNGDDRQDRKDDSNDSEADAASKRRRPGKRPDGEDDSLEEGDEKASIFSKFLKFVGGDEEEGQEEATPEKRDDVKKASDDSGNQGGKGRGRNDDRGNHQDKKPQQRNQSERKERRPQRKRVDLDEIPKKFKVNTEVTVQVSKGMIGDKGPRVTTNLSIPGRYVVLLPNSNHRGVSRRIANRKERQRLRDVLLKAELPQGMGVICRTAGLDLDEDKILRDIQQVVDLWQGNEKSKSRRAPICVYQEPDLLIRTLRDFLSEGIDEIVLDGRESYDLALNYVKRMDKSQRPRVRLYDNPKPVFEYFKLDEQILNIFRRKISLVSGAELCIDETEALIAIDINSSKSRGGKDHPETILNTNMEAADEIGRQLKLRNIGGLVVIDFIDMRSRKHQKQVLQKMRNVLGKDRAKSRLLPITRLGLMEMTRQRQHASLQDAVYETCNYCHGKGLIKSSTTISVEIQRGLREVMRRDKDQRTPIRVTVHPRVLERLRKEDSNILEQMENEFGGELSFRADADIHQEEFYFINSQTGKEI